MCEKQNNKKPFKFINENFELYDHSLLVIISKLPVFFLEMLGVRAIYNISLTSWSSFWYISNSFPGLQPLNIRYHVFKQDAWGRNFLRDIPDLGIFGIKVMPCPDFSIRRFCKENGFRSDLASTPSHIKIMLDRSQSTSQYCCTIESGEYAGPKTNLDIMKMFITSLVECMKQDAIGNKYFHVNKISIFTFNGYVQCLVDSLRIEEIDISNILSNVSAEGATAYNRAIRHVTSMRSNRDLTTKLLVVTDCECSVSRNNIQELIKSGISLSTCFVPPGNPSTLSEIANHADSGIHTQLPLDFSDPDTVKNWCDFGAQFLLLGPVSCIVPHHPDGTKPEYNIGSSSNGYIQKSVRPVIKIDDLGPMSVSVYDIIGKRSVEVYKEFKESLPKHETVALCLGKMTTSVQKGISELQRIRSDHLNNKFRKDELENQIGLVINSNKWIGFMIWVLENKKNLDPYSTKIQARYRGNKTRQILATIPNGYSLRQVNHAANCIQRFFKKKCDLFIMPLQMPLPLSSGPAPPMFGVQPISMLDELPPPPPPPMFGTPMFCQPIIHRSLSRNFLSADMMDIGNDNLHDSQIELLLKDLKNQQESSFRRMSKLRDQQNNLINKLNEFDVDKNRKETVHLSKNLVQIRDVLITGLASDEKIVTKTLGLPYSKVDFVSGSIVFSHENIKEHISLPEEYACYGRVMSVLQPAIDSVNHYIDKYDSIIPDRIYYGFNVEREAIRSFNGGTLHLSPSAGLYSENNLFRQVSTHPLPMIGLMRQTSDGMASLGPMSALRSVSCQ